MSESRYALIDCRGGRRIGLGHVVRCTELARRLRARGMAVRFLPAGSVIADAFVRRAGFRKGQPLASRTPGLILIDRPDTDTTRLRRHRERWPDAVIAALDYYDQAALADVTINLNRWREGRTGSGSSRTPREYLSKPIVRPSFRRHRRAARRSARRILLAFGGTDAKNWTAAAMLTLKPLVEQNDMRVDVLLGRPAPRVQRAAHSMGRRVHLHVGVRDPAPLFGACDLGLTGGGTVMVEAACVGLPVVVVPRTSDERAFARDFAEQGTAIVVNPASAFPRKAVAAAVASIAASF